MFIPQMLAWDEGFYLINNTFWGDGEERQY